VLPQPHPFRKDPKQWAEELERWLLQQQIPPSPPGETAAQARQRHQQQLDYFLQVLNRWLDKGSGPHILRSVVEELAHRRALRLAHEELLELEKHPQRHRDPLLLDRQRELRS
jgi:hypothetical protein